MKLDMHFEAWHACMFMAVHLNFVKARMSLCFCFAPHISNYLAHDMMELDQWTWIDGMQGLHDFLPVRNIRTLVPQIRTLEGETQDVHCCQLCYAPTTYRTLHDCNMFWHCFCWAPSWSGCSARPQSAALPTHCRCCRHPLSTAVMLNCTSCMRHDCMHPLVW